jgi:hypothetical protein
MDPPIDLDRLRLPLKMTSTTATVKRKPPLHKAGELFLKGPIPWNWLTQAGRLPGRALHVALCVWRQAGVKKSRTVKLSWADLAALEIPRSTARRGLAALESANLVFVARHAGRSPLVTILDCPESSN